MKNDFVKNEKDLLSEEISEGNIEFFKTFTAFDYIIKKILIFGIIFGIFWGILKGNYANKDYLSLTIWIPVIFSIIFVIFRNTSRILGIRLILLLTFGLIHLRFLIIREIGILYITCLIIFGASSVGEYKIVIIESIVEIGLAIFYLIFDYLMFSEFIYFFLLTVIPTLFLSFISYQILKKRVEFIKNKNLELLKTQNKLLEQNKSESISTLAGGIAHDFNNILTSVLGNIELIKLEEYKKGSIEDLIVEIEGATIRARELTKKLLTFSKSGIPLKSEIITLPTILKELGNFIFNGTSIEFQLEYDPFLKNIKGDPTQIIRIFQNLLINARESINCEGKVQIVAKNRNSDIQIGNSDTQIQNSKKELQKNGAQYVEINISDSGCGISKNNMTHIFDPYFTTKADGTGLGLTIVQSLIKQHHGKIDIKSNFGKGTEIRIILPATDEKESNTFVVSQKKNLNSKRILIMDDDQAILLILKKMLEQLHHKVDIVMNGTECLKKCVKCQTSGQPYDLVILDMIIPGDKGGKDIINDLHDLNPKLKTIMTTGFTSQIDLRRFSDYGFNSLLLKPYTFAELERALSDSFYN